MKRSHLLLFAASAGVIIASFIITGLLWNQLPAQIPTHFGISGTPDVWRSKDFIYLFLMPLVNTFVFLLLLLLYRYPQYSSWPTTLILLTVEETKREKIYEILRTMNVYILTAITLLFGYIQYVILATANGRLPGIAANIVIGFLVVLFAILIFVNVKMFTTIQKMLKAEAKTKKA